MRTHTHTHTHARTHARTHAHTHTSTHTHTRTHTHTHLSFYSPFLSHRNTRNESWTAAEFLTTDVPLERTWVPPSDPFQITPLYGGPVFTVLTVPMERTSCTRVRVGRTQCAAFPESRTPWNCSTSVSDSLLVAVCMFYHWNSSIFSDRWPTCSCLSDVWNCSIFSECYRSCICLSYRWNCSTSVSGSCRCLS